MHVSTLELADPAAYTPAVHDAGPDPLPWWDRPAALLLAAAACAAIAVLATRGLAGVPAALAHALS